MQTGSMIHDSLRLSIQVYCNTYHANYAIPVSMKVYAADGTPERKYTAMLHFAFVMLPCLEGRRSFQIWPLDCISVGANIVRLRGACHVFNATASLAINGHG